MDHTSQAEAQQNPRKPTKRVETGASERRLPDTGCPIGGPVNGPSEGDPDQGNGAAEQGVGAGAAPDPIRNLLYRGY